MVKVGVGTREDFEKTLSKFVMQCKKEGIVNKSGNGSIIPNHLKKGGKRVKSACKGPL